MRRLDVLMDKGDQTLCEYPWDVALIKKAIPELETLTNRQVERFYRDYSEDMYCAGWLIVTEDGVDSFKNWLEMDIKEENV